MSNENKIRILYVQPGKYPEERVIEHTLAAMQALVGGDIEAVYISSVRNLKERTPILS